MKYNYLGVHKNARQNSNMKVDERPIIEIRTKLKFKGTWGYN